MTLNDCIDAWKEQRTVDISQEAKLVAERIGRAHRRQKLLFALSVFYTSVFVVFAAYLYATGRMSLDDPAPIPAFGAAAIGLLAGLLRLRQQRWKRPALEGEPLRNSLRWSLNDTKGQIRELALFGAVMLFVVVPLAVWAVNSLLASGKMDPRAAISYAVLLGAVLLANLVGWGSHYWGTLMPRRARLRQLLEEMEQDQESQ